MQVSEDAQHARRSMAILVIGALLVIGVPQVIGQVLHNHGWRLIATDSSGTAGFYQTRPIATSDYEAGHLKRGLMVAACLPPEIASIGHNLGYIGEGECARGLEPVGKLLVAVEGDRIEVTKDWITVNETTYFANAKTLDRDRQNRPMPHVYPHSETVAQGMVWLFGFHDSNSWDSRYFGAIPATAVYAILPGENE